MLLETGVCFGPRGFDWVGHGYQPVMCAPAPSVDFGPGVPCADRLARGGVAECASQPLLPTSGGLIVQTPEKREFLRRRVIARTDAVKNEGLSETSRVRKRPPEDVRGESGS